MARALVTGATGFVGSHVVRALLARGEAVRCLVRPAPRRPRLAGLDIELTEGDLRDPAAVGRALRGCATAYHCAADYRFWVPDPAAMHATNVEGTRNVLRAAADAGVERVVYTSTVGTLGRCRGDRPADESTPVALGDMVGAYKRTKFLAEQVAREWASRGLPVVLVHPSAPVGEGDVKPTPTGKMIVDFLRGRVPAYVDTGLNLIDVRDVAAGHLLAAERGRAGESYVLGHRDMSLREILGTLARLSGRPAPRLRLPHWVPLAYAAVENRWARLRGHEPEVPIDSVRLARHRMFFSSRKAVAELGLPQSPIEEALRRAIVWFEAHGYVGGAPG